MTVCNCVRLQYCDSVQISERLRAPVFSLQCATEWYSCKLYRPAWNDFSDLDFHPFSNSMHETYVVRNNKKSITMIIFI